jgi:HlyD family secretion protein
MIASAGILAGIISIFLYNKTLKAQPPISVSYNPYESGVYASGVIESFQKNGSNINIYPEVEGTVINVFVADGARVKKGELLLEISHVQASAIYKQSQATAEAQKANLLSLEQQYSELLKAHTLNQKSVSQNALDNARNAVTVAQKTSQAADAQVEVDLGNLNNHSILAPVDGVVMRVVSGVGDYVSPVVGSYDPNTQGNLPIIQMGAESQYFQVRVFVDEILTPQLPNADELEATLFVRGMNNEAIPLTFVNIQPYTIPNIQLSDQRNQRVDVRVLPILFKFEKPKNIQLFPGQLVDVYLKAKS